MLLRLLLLIAVLTVLVAAQGHRRRNRNRPPNWLRQFCRFRFRHPKCRGFRPPPDRGPVGPDFSPDLPEFLTPEIVTPDPLEGVPDGLRSLTPLDFEISETARQSMRSACGRLSGGCKSQSDAVQQRRNVVLQQEVEALTAQTGGGGDAAAARLKVETRMNKTHQAKQALLADAGLLDDVEPANDGLFQGDTLLTVEQAEAIIRAVGEAKKKRRKRYAIYFEGNSTKRWNPATPIPYFFDSKFTPDQKAAISMAIQIMMRKTCLKFQEYTGGGVPATNHIFYKQANGAGYCGLSYVGMTAPQNVIYLNFASPDGCKNMTGVAIHETMHALGVVHQQVRRDRDKFITINWDNINPQNFDYFAIPDGIGGKTYTEYGVQYDYYSVMHYNAYTAAVDVSKPTMTPTFQPEVYLTVLGQRDGMSFRDIELLQKMYCKAATCLDNNVWCGFWALNKYCTSADWGSFMQTTCQKSCNLCQ